MITHKKYKIAHTKFIVSTRHPFTWDLHSRLLHFNFVPPYIVVLCFELLSAQFFVARANNALGFSLTVSDSDPTGLKVPGFAIFEETDLTRLLADRLRAEFGFRQLERKPFVAHNTGYIKLYGMAYLKNPDRLLSFLESFFISHFDDLPEVPDFFVGKYEVLDEKAD